jgi:predicted phosphate transport protein (TIGR00153 family)
MLWKKEKKVRHLLEDYMDAALGCIETFQECLFVLFEDSTSEKAQKLVKKVDKAESQADEFRDKVEFKLYRKALLPEARGDILGLVEAVDQISNWAEEVAYDIYLQRVKFPENLIEKFQQLTKMNVQCFRLLHKAVGALFTDIDAVFELTKDVDKLESQIDTLEHELIQEVFDIEERLSYQNLLHRIVRSICDISDKAENAGDRLSIVAIKKMI